MRREPDFGALSAKFVEHYDMANYGKGMVGYVMRRGHEILDQTDTYNTTVFFTGSICRPWGAAGFREGRLCRLRSPSKMLLSTGRSARPPRTAR